MNFEQLVGHFTTPSKAAAALGADRRVVDSWKTRRIPSHWQMKAQTVSEFALQADQQAKDEAAEMARHVAEQERRAPA